MKLHIDPRSSSSLRVLCVVAHKQIALEVVALSLVQGEHLGDAYRAINPAAAVPALVLDDGTVLIQSLAIVEWLEARHPEPALVPRDDTALARMRGICGYVASEVHPITNMRVRKQIAAMQPGDAAAGALATAAWCRQRSDEALSTLERLLTPVAGAFCFGDTATLADFFVTPALLNAERFGCDVAGWPTLSRIYATCLALPSFAMVQQARGPMAAAKPATT